MEEPLVSIIMPAYNAEDFIEDAINSVKNQTYHNWELLVCNDCSTDNTIKIIDKMKELDDRIKLFNLEKNSGAAVARNTCIMSAKGAYISFLDSDDLWKPTKLSKQIHFMISNNYYFSCTYYDKINTNSECLNQIIRYSYKSNIKSLLKNCPGNSTVIYNQEKLGKFYISDLRKRNDYLMWFKVLEKAELLYCLEQNLSSHRIVDASLSSNKKALVKYHWYIYRNEVNLDIFQSSYYCSYWIFKGILKKIIKIRG